jgi:hypothetical protein
LGKDARLDGNGEKRDAREKRKSVLEANGHLPRFLARISGLLGAGLRSLGLPDRGSMPDGRPPVSRRGGVGDPRRTRDVPAIGTGRFDSYVCLVYAGYSFRIGMRFFRIFPRTSFCKPQYDWDILRRPQDASVLDTFTAVWPMPQYLLRIRKKLSPGVASTWFKSRSPSGLLFMQIKERSATCGGRGSISQSSHVVPAGSCRCRNACDEETILRSHCDRRLSAFRVKRRPEEVCGDQTRSSRLVRGRKGA